MHAGFKYVLVTGEDNMSQETGKFLYFKVGLLKDSDALDALWQDALKHHLVDQPDKLIALRLTEYYELIAQDLIHPIAQVTQSILAPAQVAQEEPEQISVSSTTMNNATDIPQRNGEGTPVSNMANIPQSNGTGTSVNNITNATRNAVSSTPVNIHLSSAQNEGNDYAPANENIYAAFGGAEKNAEEAADYWALL